MPLDALGMGDALPRLDVRGYYSVNYSVCFAAGDNWSLSDGYVVDRNHAQLDWLALAVGGLRLNSPAEVDAKIAEREKAAHRAAAAGAEAAAQALGARAQADAHELTSRLERGLLSTPSRR